MKNPNSPIVLGLKLLLICFIAGGLLGLTYSVTKEPIAQVALAEATLARQQVLPDAETFEEFDISAAGSDEAYAIIQEAYIGKDASGNPVGATVKITTKAFSSGLNFTVGIGADGTVKGVEIGDHAETPGLGANASEEYFKGQYDGAPADGSLEVIKSGTPADNQILAIAGATITSRGVTDGVNVACNFYNAFMK